MARPGRRLRGKMIVKMALYLDVGLRTDIRLAAEAEGTTSTEYCRRVLTTATDATLEQNPIPTGLKITSPLQAQIVAAHAAKEMPVAIAKRLGCDESYVYVILARNNLPTGIRRSKRQRTLP